MNEEEYEKRGNKNGLVAFLIVIIVILLLIIDAVLVYFYAVNKIKKDQQDTTTTTTQPVATTVAPQDIKMPKDLTEYEAMIKDYITDNSTGELILLDDSFKKIKFDYSCTKVGTTTSKVDGHDVSYNCSKYDEDTDAYEVIITVDNKYSFKENSERTCGSDNYYIGENFVVDYDPSCAPGNENVQIYNQNKTEAYSAGGNKAPYINTLNSMNGEPNEKNYRPFIKGGSLYFIGIQSKSNNNKSTCNIYRIDLSKKNQSIDKSAGFECDFLVAD